MSNLFVITGARNSGKSFCAATYLNPSEISDAFVHDSEKSMNRVVERLAKSNLAFGHYADLSARFSDLPGEDDLLDRINKGKLPWVDKKQRSSLVAYYEYLLDDLATNLTRGKYSLYIHDTIEKLEAGMAAWVEDHKREAGWKRTAYGEMWNHGVFPLYEHLAASIFGRGVETIIFTSHLKTPWRGKRPVVGKVAPAGKKILYKLSSLFIWLVNDSRNTDGAPAGLVLKERLGNLYPDDNDEWVVEQMLPKRIPHCTWKDIRVYLDEGCDLANPAEGETMSAGEREMISELLTDEQMRLMILGDEKELAEMRAGMLSNVANGNGGNDFDIQSAIENKEETIDTAKTLKEQAREMADGGMDVEKIAEMLERPLPVIRAILKNGE